MIYATVDDNGICIGVCRLGAEVDSERLIQIAEYDPSLIGRLWNGSAFISVTPTAEPTE